jgi:hypothetical protein
LNFPLPTSNFQDSVRFAAALRYHRQDDFPEVPVHLTFCEAKRARRSTRQVDVRIVTAGSAIWVQPRGSTG